MLIQDYMVQQGLQEMNVTLSWLHQLTPQDFVVGIKIGKDKFTTTVESHDSVPLEWGDEVKIRLNETDPKLNPLAVKLVG